MSYYWLYGLKNEKWIVVFAVSEIAGDEVVVDFQCFEDLPSSESELWMGSQD